MAIIHESIAGTEFVWVLHHVRLWHWKRGDFLLRRLELDRLSIWGCFLSITVRVVVDTRVKLDIASAAAPALIKEQPVIRSLITHRSCLNWEIKRQLHHASRSVITMYEPYKGLGRVSFSGGELQVELVTTGRRIEDARARKGFHVSETIDHENLFSFVGST